MRILGIDPSKRATGLADIEISDIGKAKIHQTHTMPDFPKLDHAMRVLTLCAAAEEWMRVGGIEAVGIEYNVATKYRDAKGKMRNKSPKAMLEHANLVGGMLVLAARELGPSSVHLVSPSAVKLSLTGHGQATKDAMIRYAGCRTDWQKPKTIRASQAEADAIGVAFAAYRAATAPPF